MLQACSDGGPCEPGRLGDPDDPTPAKRSSLNSGPDAADPLIEKRLKSDVLRSDELSERVGHKFNCNNIQVETGKLFWRAALAAKKCRYCGEIVDVALRAAEEAKQMAIRAASAPAAAPVFNVNNSTHVHGGSPIKERRTKLRGWFFVALILFLFGIVVAQSNREAGGVFIFVGMVIFLLGLAAFVVRSFVRVFS